MGARERQSSSIERFAASAYSPLIDTQLAEERRAKDSLEQRGLAVITSSGTLVSLLFGFAALVESATSLRLSAPTKVLLIASMILFISAVILGVFVNRPRDYEDVPAGALKTLVKEWTDRDPIEASREVADVLVRIIAAARKSNDKKSELLSRAIALEVFAVVALGLSVMSLLLTR